MEVTNLARTGRPSFDAKNSFNGGTTHPSPSTEEVEPSTAMCSSLRCGDPVTRGGLRAVVWRCRDAADTVMSNHWASRVRVGLTMRDLPLQRPAVDRQVRRPWFPEARSGEVISDKKRMSALLEAALSQFEVQWRLRHLMQEMVSEQLSGRMIHVVT